MQNLLFTFYDWLIANEQAFGAGKGLFSVLHICLMVGVFVWLVIAYFLCRKYERFAKILIMFCCIFMIVSRTFRMILQVATGVTTLVGSLPFHLCHIMAFVLPICVFTNTKRLYPAVTFFALMGGILTFVFGDYYQYNVITFFDIESIILHIMLPSVVVALAATKQIKQSLHDLWQIPLILAPLVGWASLGNYWLNENFMYIRENGLPLNLFGTAHFMFSYLAIFIFALLILYMPLIVREIKEHKEKRLVQGAVEKGVQQKEPTRARVKRRKNDTDK